MYLIKKKIISLTYPKIHHTKYIENGRLIESLPHFHFKKKIPLIK